MSAHLTIDCTAGSDITIIAADAQRIADLLGIGVDFAFNGVKCLAHPGGDAAHLAEEQQRQQARKITSPHDGYRFASSVVRLA